MSVLDITSVGLEVLGDGLTPQVIIPAIVRATPGEPFYFTIGSTIAPTGYVAIPVPCGCIFNPVTGTITGYPIESVHTSALGVYNELGVDSGATIFSFRNSGSIGDKLLDHIFGAIEWTPPTSWYLALCTNNPAGSEITEPASGYERKLIDPTWIYTTDKISNNSIIDGPVAKSYWPRLTHFALLPNSGDRFGDIYGNFTTTITMPSGGFLRFGIDKMWIDLD